MPTYAAEHTGNGGRRQGVLTAVFLAAAVVLLNLSPPIQQEVAWAVQASVLRPFVWMQETLVQAREQATASAVLQARLDSLLGVSVSRTHLVEENRQLRALLSLSERMGPGWTPASVIRAGTAGSESTFQLNVGSDQGVDVNAPVITRHGLVGLVREVRPGSALAMDWSHPDFRASAMDSSGVAYGMVEAHRGTFREEDRLEFTGTPYTTALAPGTPVLTSGRGGLFPRGIPIGRIDEVAEEAAGWARSYRLEPLVEPAAVTHVLVASGLRALPDDVSAAWPPDSILTEVEIRSLEVARLDSLDVLRDSVEVLRERIRELVPDTGGVDGGADGGGGEGGENGRAPKAPPA